MSMVSKNFCALDLSPEKIPGGFPSSAPPFSFCAWVGVPGVGAMVTFTCPGEL